MKRLSAHMQAIGLAFLMVLGALRLPPLRSFSLPGLFTLAWLLLGLLSLLAQMRQAGLVSRRLHQPQGVSKKPLRKRGT